MNIYPSKILNMKEFIFIIVLLSVSYLSSNHPIRIVLLVISCVILFFCSLLKLKHHSKLIISKPLQVIVLIIIISLIGLISTNATLYTFSYNASLIYVTFIPFFLSNISREGLNRYLYKAFVANLIINVLIAVFVSNYSFYNYQGEMVFRGLYYEKIGCAAALIGGIPFFLNQLKHNKDKFNLIYIILTIILILATKSTTYFYMVFFIIILTLIKPTQKIQLVKLFPVFGILFILYISFFNKIYYSNFGSWFQNFTGKNISLSGRIDIWKYSLEMIRLKPILGYGYRGIWSNNTLFENSKNNLGYIFIGDHAHNGYIELFMSVGIVGTIIIGSMVHKYYMKLKRQTFKYQVSNVELTLFIYILFINFFSNQLLGTNIYWCILLTYILHFRYDIKRNVGLERN